VSDSSITTGRSFAASNMVLLGLAARSRAVGINQETVAMEELSGRLRRLYVNHPGHPLFVRGGKDLAFEQVAQVIDIARGVGLDRIALMTK
jgi:biopolymer transport protein ExbD